MGTAEAIAQSSLAPREEGYDDSEMSVVTPLRSADPSLAEVTRLGAEVGEVSSTRC